MKDGIIKILIKFFRELKNITIRKSNNEISIDDLINKSKLKKIVENSPLYNAFMDFEKVFVEHKFLGFKSRFICHLAKNKKVKPKIRKEITFNKEILKNKLNEQLILKLEKLNNKQLELIKSAIKIDEKIENGFYWDCAYRPSGQNPIHIISKDKRSNEYLFIIQPRSPIRKFVISCPAGLLSDLSFEILIKEFSDNREVLKDLQRFRKEEIFYLENGEEDKEMLTALAEVIEETGYCPLKLKKISPFALPKSAGMSNEVAVIVEALVDKDKWGISKFDVTEEGIQVEDIKYLWLNPKDFLSLCDKLDFKYIVCELETWMFFRGMMNQK